MSNTAREWPDRQIYVMGPRASSELTPFTQLNTGQDVLHPPHTLLHSQGRPGGRTAASAA